MRSTGLLRWIMSLFARNDVRDTGVWRYQVNTLTGARRIRRGVFQGYQPVDVQWLRGER